MFQIFSTTQISTVEFLSYTQTHKNVFKIQKKMMHVKEMIILGYAGFKIVWQSEYYNDTKLSMFHRVAFIITKPVLYYRCLSLGRAR